MHLGFTVQAADISIHALREEGDQALYNNYNNERNFYPRPPRGGRQPLPTREKFSPVFLSTPSARRATVTACNLACVLG